MMRMMVEPAAVPPEAVAWHAGSGSFLITRMALARAWLADPAQWKDADRAEAGALVRQFKPADVNRPGERNAGMGWLDEPEHSRVRRPIQAALMRRVTGLRPMIERIVNERLAALPAGGFDVLADYAAVIPITVIGVLFGIDTAAEVARFRAMAEVVLTIFEPSASVAQTVARQAASEEMLDYLAHLAAQRRVAPGDDLISDLVAVQAEARLSDAEVRVNCFDLLLGGAVTTADLIANGVMLLLRNPGELARLRADPALISSAVEEILRLESPAQGAQRIAAFDQKIGGCPIRAGQVAAVVTAAANRDPAVFTDPDRFEIGRHEGPHIAFGGGAHMCIGASLARLEARIAILALIQHFPNLALAAPGAPVRWRPIAFFRGLEDLCVVV